MGFIDEAQNQYDAECEYADQKAGRIESIKQDLWNDPVTVVEALHEGLHRDDVDRLGVLMNTRRKLKNTPHLKTDILGISGINDEIADFIEKLTEGDISYMADREHEERFE